MGQAQRSPTTKSSEYWWGHGAAGDWSIFRRENVISSIIRGPKTWTGYSLGNWERQRATSRGQDAYYGYSDQLAGFMLGCDSQFDNVMLGFAGGYGQGNVGFINDPASDKTDLFNLSYYGKAAFGGAYLAGVVGFTHASNDVTRAIAIEGLDARRAAATVRGNLFGTLLQAGYNLEYRLWRLTPVVGLRYGYAGLANAAESGADSVDLAVGRAYRNSLVAHLGGRLALCLSPHWRAEAYGQWEHEYADAYNDVSMAFAGSTGSYSIRSAIAERDAARAGLVAIGDLTDRFSVHLDYDAVLRASYCSQQLTGGLSIAF